MSVLSVIKQMLITGLGLIFTVGLCLIGVRMYRRAVAVVEVSETSQGDLAQEVYEYEVTKFDGFTVSGATVMSYIKTVVTKYGIPVEITTTDNTFTCIDSTYFAEFRSIGKDHYINPMKQYAVTVVRDENSALQKVIIEYIS